MHENPNQPRRPNQMPPRQRPNTRNAPAEQSRRSNPSAYRSAAPYTVPPHSGKQHVPYPSRALERKKRQRALRKRRILVFSVLALLIIALISVLTCIGYLLYSHFSERNSDSLPTTVTESLTKEESLSYAETETRPVSQTETAAETLPVYTAPNIVEGEFLHPTTDDHTKILDEEIASPSMILVDAASGIVAAQKHADQLIFPASMTKMMTILVAYETCPDLTATFKMTNEIIDPLYLAGLSLAGFVGNEEVPIIDLLYGSALPSGAEASVALAIAACGSEEAFVEQMNLRAAALGMTQTHFENCTGAHHEHHVSTLADIAVLMDYVMQDETLHEIFSTYQHTTAPTAQHPNGILLTSTVFSRMEGSESQTCTVIGGKTGYTAEAKQCLATYAERVDTSRSYICVIAGGEDKWKVVFDTISVYQYYTEP